MDSSTRAVIENRRVEGWAGEMGARWLADLNRYESMIAPVGAALMAHVAFMAGERVIDVGCGGGGTSIEIASRVTPAGKVLGLDISPDLVTAAMRRAEAAGFATLHFIEADAATFSPPETAHRLFSRFGTMFFAEPTTAFANLRRMVCKGGRADISVWASARENLWFSEVMDVIKKYIELAAPTPRAPGPFALDDPDYIIEVLGEAGFTNIEIVAWSGNQQVGGVGSPPEEVVEFYFKSMSFADMLVDQDPALHSRVVADLTELFSRYSGPAGIVMPAKAWFVSALA